MVSHLNVNWNTLECKWEVLKKVISHVQTNNLSPNIYLAKASRNVAKKTRFDKQFHEARKWLMSLDVVKDGQNYQKNICMSTKYLFK